MEDHAAVKGPLSIWMHVHVMISVGRDLFCIFVNVLSTECQLVIVVKRKRNEVGIA